MLAALGVVLLLVFWSERARYERQLTAQIWPTAALKVSILSSPPVDSRPTVMLLGDSRMAQWNLPQLTHWRVVNAGIGGATTGQIRLLASTLLAEYHPDVVVLEAGINDLKYLGLRPRMAPEIISLATTNLIAVANECSRQHCRVIILETWPPGRPGLARRLVWNAAIPASVAALNVQLRYLDSPARGVRVIDLFSEAGLKPGPQSYRDTLHFTSETYARLTRVLEKELDTELPAAK